MRKSPSPRLHVCDRCGDKYLSKANRVRYCISCREAMKLQWKRESGYRYRQANKQKVAKATAKWGRKNKKHRTMKAKERYWKDPEKYRRRSVQWTHKNPEKARASYRKRHLKQFGITPEIYNEMLEAQGGTCKICRRLCSTGRRLAVDHEHGTGHVRGLLCSGCNQGIGKFRDNPEVLERAAEYLRESRQVTLRLVSSANGVIET